MAAPPIREGIRTRSAAKQAQATAAQTPVTPPPTESKYAHGYCKPDLRDPQIVGGGKERAVVQYMPGIVISEQGRERDKAMDSHYEYEFGGPWGVTAMITLFPMLMYYLWICLWFYDGQFAHPQSLRDVIPFFQAWRTMCMRMRSLRRVRSSATGGLCWSSLSLRG